MAFDRAAAKQAGYSDQEINDYLMSKATPEQVRRRQEISAAAANEQANADALQSQAWKELIGQGVGTVASTLIPGGPALRAGMKGLELIGPLAARAGMGALGGGVGGGVEARIAGQPVAPAVGRGLLIGGVAGPGLALVGKGASEAGQAAGEALGSAGSRTAKAVGKFFARKNPIAGTAMDFADMMNEIRGPAATETAPAAEAASTGIERLKAIKPLRANASAAARLEHQIELELAMKEAKLGAAAQKRLLSAFGHESAAPSATRAVSAAKPEVGSAVSRAEAATAESTPAPTVRGPDAPKHEVQYFSESRGKHIDIEGMNQKHIERAARKLAATNPKPGSVTHKQLQALIRESIYREGTTGIHVGQQ